MPLEIRQLIRAMSLANALGGALHGSSLLDVVHLPFERGRHKPAMKIGPIVRLRRYVDCGRDRAPAFQGFASERAGTRTADPVEIEEVEHASAEHKKNTKGP